MLTTRPQPRAIMPGTSAFISAMGVSMLASSALMKSSRSQSVHRPGGGPPALLTRMSTSPAAFSTSGAARFRGYIGRNGHNIHPVGRANGGGGFFQRLCPARIHHQMHAFGGQRLGTAAPEALRACAYQGAFAGDFPDPFRYSRFFTCAEVTLARGGEKLRRGPRLSLADKFVSLGLHVPPMRHVSVVKQA